MDKLKGIQIREDQNAAPQVIGLVRKEHFNIAVAGGQGTGKSTLSALLFAKLKIRGYDYDLIQEESRKLRGEFGKYESPFERFYMWRQQEREETRSGAEHGFVTDTPLFQFYASAKHYCDENNAKEMLALRELYRMCLEIPKERYSLIVLTRDPYEIIDYKNDTVRLSSKERAAKRNEIIIALVEHLWSDKTLYVKGDSEQRSEIVYGHIEDRLKEIKRAGEKSKERAAL